MPRPLRAGLRPAGRLAPLVWLALLGLACAAGRVQAQAGLQAEEVVRQRREVVPIRFEHLSIEDGMSQGDGAALLQDRQGYLWIGTQDGLNRYDGRTFRAYRAIPFDTTSFAGSNITALIEDREGSLWIGTSDKGVNRFDPVTERFTRFPHVPGDSTALTSDYVLSLREDREGAIWIATTGGLTRLDPRTGAFRRFFHEPGNPRSLGSNTVYGLHVDAVGVVWAATRNGLSRFDAETQTFTRFLDAPDEAGRPPRLHVTESIYEDPGRPGIFWVASMGIVRFDARTGAHVRYLRDPELPDDLPANLIVALAPDPQDRDVLWATTVGRGIVRFDLRTGRFTAYGHNPDDPEDPQSLPSNDVHTILTDRTGSVWVGLSHGKGIARFDPHAGSMVHVRRVPGNPNSLTNNTVRAILEDRSGALWIGTEQGLNRIDRATGAVRQWLPGEGGLRGRAVKAILEDRSGGFWLGTDVGLGRMNRRSGRITYVTREVSDPSERSRNNIVALREDGAGNLWVGTWGGGLGRRDARTGAFTWFEHDPADAATLSSNYVSVIYEDHAGCLWVGTRDGLNRMEPETGAFTRYRHDPTDVNSLSANGVWALHERAREPGVLWVGTHGGLTRYDTRAGSFTHFTERDGLLNGIIYGILEDEEGRLWMSTNGGIFRFDPAARTFDHFDRDSGIQSREFNMGAHFRSASGEMFFGGINGFNAFHPRQMGRNLHPPIVRLTGLRLFNEPIPVGPQSVLRRPLYETEALRLGHNQNVVTFEFIAFHYRNAAENRYAYRLEGFDADWVEAGSQTAATYMNLKPGTYTFRVKAANSDGVWNEEGAALQLVILPPWWASWWAYVLYVLLAAGGLASLAQFQHRRVIRREREKSLLLENELRTKAAEAWASYLHAENKRQTQELEQARSLQLSMLPDEVPVHPTVEIAAYMKTATEVGGDYYDFHVAEDGTLTFAFGDATGHGIPAGTMVTAVKSLFTAFAEEADITCILRRATRALKRMNLPKLYMALALGRLRGHTLELAGAGMPAALVFRAATGALEEIPLKGIPLGSYVEFPYATYRVRLDPRDTVALLTDGFPELRNEAGELLGYDRAADLLREAAHRSPREIVEHLTRAATDWTGGQPPSDDMTFVVMKVR